MNSKKFTLQFVAITLALALVVLSIFMWLAATRTDADQGRLLKNIGEIERIDEVLSSTALLATATGDPAYESRYNDHVVILDSLLAETLTLFSTPKVRAMLKRTERANQVLVSVETRALEQTHGLPNPTAYASLLSSEYKKYKQLYAHGIGQAFAEMQIQAKKQLRLLNSALIGLGLASVLLTVVASRLAWISKTEHLENLHQRAQLDIMRAIVRTFMDVQNNLLNNMVYFRTKAAHNLPFDERDVALIDEEIVLAKQKLAYIAETDIAEVRDLGGIVVMTTRKSYETQEPKPDLAHVA